MVIEALFSSSLQAVFYIITLIFVCYSLFLAYHWFTYGDSRTVSTFSLAIYLVVSAPLFLTMAIALSAIVRVI